MRGVAGALPSSSDVVICVFLSVLSFGLRTPERALSVPTWCQLESLYSPAASTRLGRTAHHRQERHEQLSSFRDRNDKEMQFLNTQMTAIKQDREKLMDQFNLVKKTMDSHVEETTKLKAQIADHTHQMDVHERNIQSVSREISGLLGERWAADHIVMSSPLRSVRGVAPAHRHVTVSTFAHRVPEGTCTSGMPNASCENLGGPATVGRDKRSGAEAWGGKRDGRGTGHGGA